jgi:long-chain acyl-CoA synthetase
VSAEPRTLAELIATHARENSTRLALAIDGAELTYGELDAAIERTADALFAAGIRHGDRVALMLGNSLPFVTAFYGAMRIGAVAVALNPMYRDREVATILEDSEPSLAFVQSELWPQAATSFLASSVPSLVFTEGDPPSTDPRMSSWATFLAAAAPRGSATRGPEPNDLALLCYTSGTTGRPKGAMHSHATLLANCRQAGTQLRRHPGSEDRVLVSVPLGHLYGLQSGINGLFRVGGSCVVLRRFDATATLRAIEDYRCTYMLGAPAMFAKWLEVLEHERFDLTSLRVVTTGTASLAASVLDRFVAIANVAISESYGLTEAGPTTHSNSNGPIDKIGSVGPPIPDVESRLVDADGNVVAPGEPGEIEVRSPGLMLGYWNAPEATAAAFRDGWLRTGDVAVCDADGYYTIVDRLKDMISVSGFKVWPREIEDTLVAYSGVREAAVVGVADADGSERPYAFVIRDPHADVSEDALLAHVAASLARYKLPARIEFVDDFPRVSTGKVMRRELRQRILALGSNA